MRFPSPLLVSLAIVVTSCSPGASNPSATPPSGPAAPVNAQSGATGQLDAAGVQALVRARLKDSQVDGVQAEMKDVQWVVNYLGLPGTTLPLATPVWVVVAKGQIRGSREADLTGDTSVTFTTVNFVVVAGSGEFIKTHLGGRQPTKLVTAKIDATTAQQVVRDAYKSSQLDNVQAELKTYQWVSDNLGTGQLMYTMDSPVWIVTATGKLQGDSLSAESGSTPPTFKVGKFAVDAEAGLIMSTALYPNAFSPQSAPPQAPEPTDEGTYLSPLRPSPHP